MRTMGLGAALMAGVSLVMAGCSEEPLAPRPVDHEALAKPAAPIGGGTLLVMGDTAVAADPDTDEVYVADMRFSTLRHTISFELGDEPGRIIEARGGHAIVALRRGGRLAVIDVQEGTVVRETAVCPEPRGMDLAEDALYVACAGGELVTLTPDASAITRTLRLDRDLRDVLSLGGGRLAVSQFRAASVLVVDADGTVVHEERAHDTPSAEAAVGYRMREIAPGQVVMLHQLGATRLIPIDAPPPQADVPSSPSPYGGGTAIDGPGEGEFCTTGGIVSSAATVFDLTPWIGEQQQLHGPVVSTAGDIGPLVLPVDVDANEDGLFAAVGAGNDLVFFGNLSSLDPDRRLFTCSMEATRVVGMPVAVELDELGTAVVQTRSPARLIRVDASGARTAEVELPGPSRRDLGHAVFHTSASPSSPIACASCHPEGREDGRTWAFEEVGQRRTQTVAGGVLDTEPLHWDAEFGGFEDLMTEVFVDRMGGLEPGVPQLEALSGWLNQIPHVQRSAVADEAAIARGEALYWDEKVACGSCHDGTKLTNNLTVDVGTGMPLQVPSLVGIMDRAPFMHDGCAPDMKSRFTDLSCGGGDQHGVTSHLTEAQIDDLLTYLDSL